MIVEVGGRTAYVFSVEPDDHGEYRVEYSIGGARNCYCYSAGSSEADVAAAVLEAEATGNTRAHPMNREDSFWLGEEPAW